MPGPPRGARRRRRRGSRARARRKVGAASCRPGPVMRAALSQRTSAVVAAGRAALADHLPAAAVGPAVWPGDDPVLLAQLVNIAGEPHRAFAEHDQVVADAFQLRHGMGGVQHGSACLGAGLEHGAQEFSPGQRIKVGHRLIEQEQLRLLGQHQGESHLGALAAGQGADPRAGPDGQPPDPFGRHGHVEAAVHAAAYLQDIGDAQPRPQRRVLGDEPDAAQPLRRGAASSLDTFPCWPEAGPPPCSSGWSCRSRSGRPAPPRSRLARPGCSHAGPRCLRP